MKEDGTMTVGELKEVLKEYDDDMCVGIESKCNGNDGRFGNVGRYCIACQTAMNLHAKKVKVDKMSFPFMVGDHCVMLSTMGYDTDLYRNEDAEIM